MIDEVDIELIRDMFDGVMTKPVEQIDDKILEARSIILDRKLPLIESVNSAMNELRDECPDCRVYLYKLTRSTAVNHNFDPCEQYYISVGVV